MLARTCSATCSASSVGTPTRWRRAGWNSSRCTVDRSAAWVHTDGGASSAGSGIGCHLDGADARLRIGSGWRTPRGCCRRAPRPCRRRYGAAVSAVSSAHRAWVTGAARDSRRPQPVLECGTCGESAVEATKGLKVGRDAACVHVGRWLVGAASSLRVGLYNRALSTAHIWVHASGVFQAR